MPTRHAPLLPVIAAPADALMLFHDYVAIIILRYSR